MSTQTTTQAKVTAASLGYSNTVVTAQGTSTSLPGYSALGIGTGQPLGWTTTGTSGQYLGVNGSSGATWSTISQNGLKVKGDLELQGEDADIVIDGKRLSDTLNTVMERLNMFHLNPELEKDWEDLAELGRLYREKEAWVKERAKMLKLLESSEEDFRKPR